MQSQADKIEPVMEEGPREIGEEDFQALGAEPEELEAETAITASTLKQPQRPSAEAVAAHMLTHMPYAAWCKHCVAGRGHEDPHPRVDGAN